MSTCEEIFIKYIKENNIPNTKFTVKQIIDDTNISRPTVYRLLKKHGILPPVINDMNYSDDIADKGTISKLLNDITNDIDNMTNGNTDYNFTFKRKSLDDLIVLKQTITLLLKNNISVKQISSIINKHHSYVYRVNAKYRIRKTNKRKLLPSLIRLYIKQNYGIDEIMKILQCSKSVIYKIRKEIQNESA